MQVYSPRPVNTLKYARLVELPLRNTLAHDQNLLQFSYLFQTLAVQPFARASKQPAKERELYSLLLKSNAATIATVYEPMFQPFHNPCFLKEKSTDKNLRLSQACDKRKKKTENALFLF